MRSRYAAFAVGDAAYLLRTWHRSTRPKRLNLDSTVRWTRLEVIETKGGGPFDEEGHVLFRAHHEIVDRATVRSSVLRERSQFVREDRRWVYLAAVS
jgi:SEC-C motif domain protein